MSKEWTCQVDESPGPGDMINRQWKREISMMFDEHVTFSTAIDQREEKNR